MANISFGSRAAPLRKRKKTAGRDCFPQRISDCRSQHLLLGSAFGIYFADAIISRLAHLTEKWAGAEGLVLPPLDPCILRSNILPCEEMVLPPDNQRNDIGKLFPERQIQRQLHVSPPSHSRCALLDTLAPSTPCLGRFRCTKTTAQLCLLATTELEVWSICFLTSVQEVRIKKKTSLMVHLQGLEPWTH